MGLKTWRMACRAILAVASVLGSAGARAAEITVLTAGAFKPVLLAVQPGFESTTGDTLKIENGTAGELTRQIAAGASFSVLIAPKETVQALGGSLLPGSAAAVAKVGIGVVVKQGAAVPDVSTVAALRQALLAAPSIAMIDPASGGSSGPAVLALFERLGIAEAVRGRLVLKQGGAVADLVADGHAALGLHQISEILPVAGVVLAGPLPEAVQTYTTYAAALASHPTDPAAAQTLVTMLHGPAALAALRARGMEAVASP